MLYTRVYFGTLCAPAITAGILMSSLPQFTYIKLRRYKVDALNSIYILYPSYFVRHSLQQGEKQQLIARKEPNAATQEAQLSVTPTISFPHSVPAQAGTAKCMLQIE